MGSMMILGKIIRDKRLLMSMKLRELSCLAGVSVSHLGRIERGERFPSAGVLRKIAEPLGYSEIKLLTLAGYLSPKGNQEAQVGRLDPYVAGVLSQEPVELQRAVIAILLFLKNVAEEIKALEK